MQAFTPYLNFMHGGKQRDFMVIFFFSVNSDLNSTADPVLSTLTGLLHVRTFLVSSGQLFSPCLLLD